ncbi:FAD:protein FMN transferase [Vicingus serpentipes]|uniref:FAD:protein FMN transferase n=1 Tax=Vicingus serpentipes TaxID=1926625 RepID=A0A5C6RXH9_9FLAO|nr:FAD:protein FMN transferase [Vicingus serpentipes]TXB66062.1 FAD:protein FMN transferase [Vicingus serpentipes]
MKKIIALYFILFTVSCAEPEPKNKEIKVEGLAQGTSYHITYISNDGVNYQRSIDSLLIEIDNSLSTYQPRSIISKFNQADSTQKVDQLFIEVFNDAKLVFEATNGALDPTVAPVVNAWGFGFKNLENTDSTFIDSLLQYVNFNAVTIKDSIVFKSNPNIMIDFNAIAQGYSVDVLAEFLEAKGIENYMVEVGGELRVKGKNTNNKLWRIGIDKPIENNINRDLEAIINLDNIALATSGNYRKFYEKNGVKYSHTLNPKTGYPVQHTLLSATVLAKTCSLADAYATAFMVLGLEKSKEIVASNSDLEVLFIYVDEKNEFQTFASQEISKFIELNDVK